MSAVPPSPPTQALAETPSRGLVTWASEGTEGGRFHSRKLHVPSDTSGLTLGRGYDMKHRSAATILQDLTAAGVPLADAQTISEAAGLAGEEARQFIVDKNLQDFEITKAAQKLLFDTTYAAEAKEAKRLCTKADVVETYGKCDWDKLHPAIADMLVDLKYRGDYTGGARAKIQRHVVKNDLRKFAAAMSDAKNWPNVPSGRFKARVAALKAAVRELDVAEAAARRRKEIAPAPRPAAPAPAPAKPVPLAPKP